MCIKSDIFPSAQRESETETRKHQTRKSGGNKSRELKRALNGKEGKKEHRTVGQTPNLGCGLSSPTITKLNVTKLWFSFLDMFTFKAVHSEKILMLSRAMRCTAPSCVLLIHFLTSFLKYVFDF
ncbi:hypothetical protein AVEN_158604-1 [Araneus ventricosus]|uniref:Uncharacterized protein n=1 Tax=Araneus ventricosus TaxID=182803 RepID=A0A4Y2JM31_ARAVE|nr:hypothetical protein AVEN_158604-1 [Araneus ventricosus]